MRIIKTSKPKIVKRVGKLNLKIMSDLSIGEKRVRSAFNPSGVGNVNCIKNDTAKLINVCEEMRPKEGEVVEPEKLRLISLAQTAYEEAAMWAVKAATFE